MPSYHYSAMTSSGEEVRDVVDADDMQAARRSLSKRGLFITRLVESSESSDEESVDSDEMDSPAKSLADFGWLVEPTDDGGVQLRRSNLWRSSMVGCSLVILILFGSVASAMLFTGKGFLQGPPGGGTWRIPMLLIALSFIGGFACFIAAIMWQVLRLALHREVWEATPNRLIVRRGLVGFLRSREWRGCQLLLEPHFKKNEHNQQWRLAAVCDGERHYLRREPEVRIGPESTGDSETEATAIASLLADHTGWELLRSNITIDGPSKPPADSNEDELLAALRTRGFVCEMDQQWRLTIRPPKLSQWFGGLVMLGIGIVWLWVMAGAVDSYLNEVDAQQDALMHIGYWVLITPMLMGGVGISALGVAIFFGRERWTVDRNLLLVRCRLFGWTSEREFVDARWNLVRVRCTSREQPASVDWRLELKNASGQSLRVLRTDRDDDVPRLLGTILSQCTGWPLGEENRAESGPDFVN